MNLLHAWLKDLRAKNVEELNGEVETKKTIEFGHHFFIVKGELVAFSGDGRMHCEVLHGLLDHSSSAII